MNPIPTPCNNKVLKHVWCLWPQLQNIAKLDALEREQNKWRHVNITQEHLKVPKKITIMVFQYPTPPKYNISIGAIIIFSHSHSSFIAYEHIYNNHGCCIWHVVNFRSQCNFLLTVQSMLIRANHFIKRLWVLF